MEWVIPNIYSGEKVKQQLGSDLVPTLVNLNQIYGVDLSFDGCWGGTGHKTKLRMRYR